jgi:hypothetical protein
MTSAEVRLLRFIQAATARAQWVPYQMIRNTEDLLPGDEKALPALMARGLVEEATSKAAYRVGERASKLSGEEKTGSSAYFYRLGGSPLRPCFGSAFSARPRLDPPSF